VVGEAPDRQLAVGRGCFLDDVEHQVALEVLAADRGVDRGLQT
jgi:hypothetical protein